MSAAPQLPIVLACAGSSFAGKLAYDLARELDRRGAAEMSCLAGFGASRPVFLRKAESRKIWVIDGCPIDCGLGIFQRIGLHPDRHIRLADLGISKNVQPPGGVDLQALVDRILRHPEP